MTLKFPLFLRALTPIMLIFCLSAPVCSAATSEWTSNEGGRMRLILAPPDAEGRRAGALEIEPLPGWITYWREPGDSGIPPQLAADPGSPYMISALAYPVPRRIDVGDVRDIGYDGPVTFTFTLEAAADAANVPLNATAFIGICRNICIPFQASFSLPLTPDATKDAEALAVIARAAATMPQAPSDDFKVASFEMTADLKQLTVNLQLPKTARGEPELFVTGPSGYVFTHFEGRRAPDGNYRAVFPIEKLPRNYTFSGQSWSVLAVSGTRAMESPLAFD
ncbi:protein-disulfide reductase DsbD domain-containing protein [Rhizobium sp. RU36D]|uniref:protein-disulfide reductase DsbD domain-containing protein n=1 Tax=Rhizobium sp. RU36D TaxID=1907415 RepID=UPI0009D903FF|nr:protein-disulfide reductase DsbD domain-containing protein [Rhizobium sp. RU36D]SMC91084.1 Thiol-disulfide interchange protein, contains DsbC and DsbD domains [Rhizobium sp. RU36D]